MSKSVEEVIRDLQVEITKDEAALMKKKEAVNTLCSVVGRPVPYVIAAAEQPNLSGPIRPDQFYAQALASSVRQILEMRFNAQLGAASVNEIYDALIQGGYAFDTKNEEIARKSLRNSLAKNTALFHKLPNGRFGLRLWYPKVRDQKNGPLNSPASEDEDESAVSPADPE